ncbi:MAG TPA: hypothetical protein VLT87_11125 [Thermoanaerobaculia bacterium]|nr:hypothetical protein [Thermoanaerobaculia bacterium]
MARCLSTYPGGAFVLEGDLWFIVDEGDLAVIASNGTRMRSFVREHLAKDARPAKERALGLLRLLSAVEGAWVDFDNRGIPEPEMQALSDRCSRVASLLEGFDEAHAEVE